MDVLKPAIIRIDGRCYRKNPIESSSGRYEEEEEDFRELNTSTDEAYSAEICEAFEANVEETENGYKLAMPIPSDFFKYIIGKKGETKKKLENETCTKIFIPRQGSEGAVVINGRDRKGVLSARTRISIMVESARERYPFTHFLSIPVRSPQIIDRFKEFKDDVCRFCGGDRGIDDTIFQNPNKLHMTLGTMVLLNEAEISQATNLLVQCKQEIIDPVLGGSPLLSSFRGLEYMNDDPCEVDVLYAKVELQDESDRLQILADRLVDRFTAAGLMQKGYERVKLHATVMNTLMRKDPSGTSIARAQDGNSRESFDATNVLRLYGDYNFGPYHIDNVQISQRYSTGCDGYYACEAKLGLP